MLYKSRVNLWIWPGEAAWHFVTLPKDQSGEIKKVFGSSARGFGSLKVKATIGKTSWDTSIFPDSKSGCYMLPIKKSVRKAENIKADDNFELQIDIKILE